jgi:hypothetical protein
MKTKIILAAMIITLVAVVVIRQRIDRKIVERAIGRTRQSVQISGKS